MRMSVFGVFVPVVMALPATTFGALSSRSTNEQILNSVDQFIIRQMDKFAIPEGYPTGYCDPRLLQSYDVNSGDDLYYRADVYDSALAAMYILARGNSFYGGGYLDRARSIVDGIRLVEDYDPLYEHAVRSSYKVDDLYDESTGYANIDQADVGVGNICFATLALVRFYAATGEQVYLDSAKGKADFIDANFRQTDVSPPVFQGFSCGIDIHGNFCHPDGRSTENNIDVYSMARSIAKIVDSPGPYEDMADHAKYFVHQMFDERDSLPGYLYLTGSEHKEPWGRVKTWWPGTADAQSWTTLASVGGPDQQLQDANRCATAMEWLAANLRVPCPSDDSNASGFSFSEYPKGVDCIQSEISASAAMAYLLMGEEAKGESVLSCLDWIRLEASGHDPNGIGLVATPEPGGAPTGFGTTYPNSRHVASTVWFGFAVLLDDNPSAWTANPLAVVPATLSGDANGDGIVDAADYIILKLHMGQSTSAGASDGDFDGDGTVDWDDLQTLISNIGAGRTPSEISPEPATLLLLALSGLAMLRRRER